MLNHLIIARGQGHLAGGDMGKDHRQEVETNIAKGQGRERDIQSQGPGQEINIEKIIELN